MIEHRVPTPAHDRSLASAAQARCPAPGRTRGDPIHIRPLVVIVLVATTALLSVALLALCAVRAADDAARAASFEHGFQQQPDADEATFTVYDSLEQSAQAKFSANPAPYRRVAVPTCFGVPANASAGEVCLGRGECVARDACRCRLPWIPPSCKLAVPGTYCNGVDANDGARVCSGRGKCVAAQALPPDAPGATPDVAVQFGECACPDQFDGDDCQIDKAALRAWWRREMRDSSTGAVAAYLAAHIESTSAAFSTRFVPPETASMLSEVAVPSVVDGMMAFFRHMSGDERERGGRPAALSTRYAQYARLMLARDPFFAGQERREFVATFRLAARYVVELVMAPARRRAQQHVRDALRGLDASSYRERTGRAVRIWADFLGKAAQFAGFGGSDATADFLLWLRQDGLDAAAVAELWQQAAAPLRRLAALAHGRSQTLVASGRYGGGPIVDRCVATGESNRTAYAGAALRAVLGAAQNVDEGSIVVSARRADLAPGASTIMMPFNDLAMMEVSMGYDDAYVPVALAAREAGHVKRRRMMDASARHSHVGTSPRLHGQAFTNGFALAEAHVARGVPVLQRQMDALARHVPAQHMHREARNPRWVATRLHLLDRDAAEQYEDTPIGAFLAHFPAFDVATRLFRGELAPERYVDALAASLNEHSPFLNITALQVATQDRWRRLLLAGSFAADGVCDAVGWALHARSLEHAAEQALHGVEELDAWRRLNVVQRAQGLSNLREQAEAINGEVGVAMYAVVRQLYAAYGEALGMDAPSRDSGLAGLNAARTAPSAETQRARDERDALDYARFVEMVQSVGWGAIGDIVSSHALRGDVAGLVH